MGTAVDAAKIIIVMDCNDINDQFMTMRSGKILKEENLIVFRLVQKNFKTVSKRLWLS